MWTRMNKELSRDNVPLLWGSKRRIVQDLWESNRKKDEEFGN